MILKLIYFFIIFISFEATVLSLNTHSFIKDIGQEYLEKKDSADTMARMMVLNFSRYLENAEKQIDTEDINTYFSRSVLISKENSVRIKNIFYLATDGSVLASFSLHKDLYVKDTNDPIFTKALRLRRGQVELTLYDTERNESTGYFENKLLENIPDLKEKDIMVSAPVYIQDKMDVYSSIHIIYEREDFEKFLSLKKNQYRERLILTIIIGLLFSLILWLFFYFIVYFLIKEKISENSYESLLRKEGKQSPSAVTEEKASSEQNKNSKSLDAVYLD